MKTINVSFDDKEIEEIERAKRDLSWRDFILSITKSRIVELYDGEGVKVRVAFEVCQNVQHTFTVPVPIDLEAVVVKTIKKKEERKRGKRNTWKKD